MFEFVDWMSCKHCSSTNCLFKIRVCHYTKKKTGNIVYKTTRICKVCYLEICREKNEKYYSKNSEKLLLNQTIYRIIHKKKYNKRARKYYQKRRIAALDQKRSRYVSIRKNKGIVDKAKFRDSLVLFRR